MADRLLEILYQLSGIDPDGYDGVGDPLLYAVGADLTDWDGIGDPLLWAFETGNVAISGGGEGEGMQLLHRSDTRLYYRYSGDKHPDVDFRLEGNELVVTADEPDRFYISDGAVWWTPPSN